jgi:hypothetical protein
MSLVLLCCAWPLANRTSRDVLAPNARSGFFANGDTHRSLGQRPRIIDRPIRPICPEGANAPGAKPPGDVVHSLWPIGPVEMF